MDKVLDYIEKYRMIDEGDHIIAGVSGGADSVCLLFLLSQYRERLGISLEVVHIEHGIRGKESLEDAAFVENLCETFGVPFTLFRRDVPGLAKKWKCSLEEAGRRARYEAFCRQAEGKEHVKIAVAHNRDDLAETVLFHILRGCSLKGLSGIPPVRDGIIRPLLGLTRREIEEILRREGLGFRVDRTNLEEDYTRNRIRNVFLPALEREINAGAKAHLASLAEKAGKAEEYLRSEAKAHALGILSRKQGKLFLEKRKLQGEKELMQEYILLYSLDQLSGRKDVTEKHVEAARELLWKQSGRRLELPGGICIRNQGDYLILEKRSAKEFKKEEAKSLAVPGETIWGNFRFTAEILPRKDELIEEKMYTKWFDYDTIKDTISLRSRRTGDYLTIGSERMHQSLKKYLINEKIPADERDKVLLLAEGSHILWAVRHRISESYKVTKNTRRVLKVTAEPLGEIESTNAEG